MDKSTFEKLIISDSEISHTEALLLEDLQEAFPYCQSAHLLIAKDSQQKKSMLYPRKLRKASTYILDRRVLQHFLTKTKSPAISPVIETIAPQRNTLIEEIENTIREIKASREQLFKTSKSNEIQEKTIATFESTHFNKITASETRLGEEIVKSESKTAIELFLSYLNHENAISTPNTLPKQDEIIDKFLETEPKITRSISGTLIDEKTQDLSVNSTELKIELVTENYALILLKQNKREKAIEIYKKLILKYPNKSAYFETKLNEI